MDKRRQGSVSDSALIPASPERVYSILADYRTHHPAIVPKKYFTRLEVEEGGIGAGTRTRLSVNIAGIKKTVLHVITEPQPGRVLVESDMEGATVTTFRVDPADGKTNLTISTDFRTEKGGFLGSIERYFTIKTLKHIYKLELANITAYASDPTIHVATR
ncbi:MAG TPA: SRPBCC family protein [Acidobacteriota bacterium]|nr:SRPBCC family protein [Acidobacteriota bacterium]